MRRFLLAVVMFGAAAGAQAADMPDFLRGSLLPSGPSPTVNWQGFYVGGQGAIGESDMNFTGSTQSVAAKLLSNTADGGSSLRSRHGRSGGKISVRGTGFGGFAGYNWQWDNVVFGLEFNYLHGKFGGSQSDSMSRQFVDAASGTPTSVTYRVQRLDGDLRHGDVPRPRRLCGRIFLPYMFGGVALGQADIVRTATYHRDSGQSAAAPVLPTCRSPTDGRTIQPLIYGYSGGARRRHHADVRPVPAGRMGIRSFHLGDRHRRQHRPRRSRLQVLIADPRSRARPVDIAD